MKSLLTFCVLLILKIMSRLFFKIDIGWVGGKKQRPFEGARLIILLNHTSLFEPIYLGVLPIGLLWRLARRGLVPGADITMKRPVAGLLLRLIAFNAVSISRRRDETWKRFLQNMTSDSMIVIAAEGRMKRPNGLDKYGHPMTVQGGVADVLERMIDGQMVIAYSGGLHHVLAPGQHFPRLFKRVCVNLEMLDIAEYKARMGFEGNHRVFRLAVVRDLESRRDHYCPSATPADDRLEVGVPSRHFDIHNPIEGAE